MKQATQGRALALLLALVLSLGFASSLTLAAPQSAQAASQRSAGGMWAHLGGWLGNYYNETTGTYVYCVDLWVSDLGSGGQGERVQTIPGAVGGDLGGTREISGVELQMLNYAVTVHGQTADHITAAAVAAFVWNFTSTEVI